MHVIFTESYIAAGVSDWLEERAATKSERSKDIANNVWNDFKAVAQILIIQLYGLTLPIIARDQEVDFRCQWVMALLTNSSYLDDHRMVIL